MVQDQQKQLVGHIVQYLKSKKLFFFIENKYLKPVSLKNVLNDVSLESIEEKWIYQSFMISNKPETDSKKKKQKSILFNLFNQNFLTNYMTLIPVFAKCSIGFDSMFKTIKFPTSIPNLTAYYCQIIIQNIKNQILLLPAWPTWILIHSR